MNTTTGEIGSRANAPEHAAPRQGARKTAGAAPTTSSTPMNAPAPAIPRRGLGFALAGIAAMLMLAGSSAPSPFYPVMQEHLGIGAVGITIAFAAYAVALLAALLTIGAVSDHIGRRPVVSAGFALLAASVLVVWHADSGAALYLGRGLQGLASGALVSTMSAMLADFAPAGAPQRATLVNTIAPIGGLAVGVIGAGALLQLAPDAATWTFLPLVLAYAAIAAIVWAVPETSAREAGWFRSLRPRAAVPAAARRLFVVSMPIVLGGWATGGLFFSLGPSIVRGEFGVDGPFSQGLVIGLLPAAGTLAALVLRGSRPVVAAVYGASALATGTALMLLALTLGSLPVYVAAVIVTGTGFGTAFMGTIGSLVPLVEPHERAELFAALYIVSYLSFGIPTIVAGALVSTVGLHAAVIGYGAVVVLAAGVAAVLRARTRTPLPAAS